jgi:hypothetical protein
VCAALHDGGRERVRLFPCITDLVCESGPDLRRQRGEQSFPHAIVVGIPNAVVDVTPPKRGHCRDELPWHVQVAHDLTQHLDELPALRDHVGLGEQRARPLVDLEQSMVEGDSQAVVVPDDGLPALLHQPFALRVHGPPSIIW